MTYRHPLFSPIEYRVRHPLGWVTYGCQSGAPCSRGCTAARSGCIPKEQQSRKTKQQAGGRGVRTIEEGVLKMRTLPMRKRKGSILRHGERLQALDCATVW